ncbi:MAG: alpha-amylase [Anaerolineae bacterium]|nr:alpha-amylase [Anaerolineae bacterium]
MTHQRHWIEDAVVYHIYPLGLCGAPHNNDFISPPAPRLKTLYEWLDHIQNLGANAIYLGPLFESSAHGYDTADYFHLDRRLGDDDTLRELCSTIHQRGMRLIFDGVFHHVGRHFWAFRNLLEKRQDSPFCTWFHHLDFTKSNSYGDPFWYEGWNGCEDLIKLNLRNPQVCQHLFAAIKSWVANFDIDGLRLDAADVMDVGFLTDLASFCRSLKPDFWLMGEMVHGDYRRLANPSLLDSVTNYECYKGLYSSLNDRNYFEIAYALNRQSGNDGLYRHLRLYNFADNHDVNRVASTLLNQDHLYPLYILLFCMPGVPSIYYGSEWGIEGKRTATSDAALRPALSLQQVHPTKHHALPGLISRLAHIRRSSRALCSGSYTQLFVSHEQLAFSRQHGSETVVIALNAANHPAMIDIALPQKANVLYDMLNPGDHFAIVNGKARIELQQPCWGRILQVEQSQRPAS